MQRISAFIWELIGCSGRSPCGKADCRWKSTQARVCETQPQSLQVVRCKIVIYIRICGWLHLVEQDARRRAETEVDVN